MVWEQLVNRQGPNQAASLTGAFTTGPLSQHPGAHFNPPRSFCSFIQRTKSSILAADAGQRQWHTYPPASEKEQVARQKPLPQGPGCAVALSRGSCQDPTLQQRGGVARPQGPPGHHSLTRGCLPVLCRLGYRAEKDPRRRERGSAPWCLSCGAGHKAAHGALPVWLGAWEGQH